MRFQATVRLDGRTATGIEVPTATLESLGPGKRPKVRVTINGYTYPSTVGVMGGRSLIPVSAEVRARAGIVAGDRVEVEIEPDLEPRSVEIPADFAAALDRQPPARAGFDRLSPSRQRHYVLAIEQAKTPQTRQRRADRAIADLALSEGSRPKA